MRLSILVILFSCLQLTLSSQFVEIWGTAGDEAIHGLLTTSDGGYITYGLTSGSGEGQYDFMLIKQDPSGNVLWSSTYGTSGIENGHAVGLDEMANGDLWLTGSWEQESGDPDRAIITKLSSNGAIIWTRMLEGEGLYFRDAFQEVKEMPDGNMLAVGWAQSTTTGNQDVYLMKITPDGDFIDGLAFGGGYSDHSVKVFLDADGFYLAYIGDEIGPGVGASGLARLDYNLNIEWNKMYGTASDETIGDMDLRPDGTFMAFGGSQSVLSNKGFISQIDNAGELLWTRTIESVFSLDRVNDALFLPDGSYLVSMTSFSLDRIVLAKFDELHQVLWAKQSSFGTASNVEPRANNLVLEGDEVLCITNVEGVGAGGFDLEVDRFASAFGPCDWEDIDLEIELVNFQEEDMFLDEVQGGSLIEFELVRNIFEYETLSISDCSNDYCFFDGMAILPSLCEGETGVFDYESTLLPPGELTWEWQIGSEVFDTEEGLYTAVSFGSIPTMLTITANELEDCGMELDTLFQVAPLPDFEIIGDLELCVGEVGQYEVAPAIGDVEWSGGETSNSIQESFTDDSVIEVTVVLDGCEASQSVDVQVTPYPTGNIIAPSLICANDQVEFTLDGEFAEVMWGNGATVESISITASADSTISVTLSNNACDTEETFDYIVIHPAVTSSATDLSLCANVIHQLGASGGGDYLWSNGSTGSQSNYLILVDSLVWVSASNVCGGDTVDISIHAAQPIDLGVDTLFVVGEHGELQLVDLPADIFYNVFNGPDLVCGNCADLFVNFQGDDDFTLVFEDEFGCEFNSMLIVETLPCTDVYVPNSFTPNNDGVNDQFGPVLRVGCVDRYTLMIYDRLGGLVFESNDAAEKWSGDGSFSSNYYSADEVYTYRLLYSLSDSAEVIERLGSVTLIR